GKANAANAASDVGGAQGRVGSHGGGGGIGDAAAHRQSGWIRLTPPVLPPPLQRASGPLGSASQQLQPVVVRRRASLDERVTYVPHGNYRGRSLELTRKAHTANASMAPTQWDMPSSRAKELPIGRFTEQPAAVPARAHAPAAPLVGWAEASQQGGDERGVLPGAMDDGTAAVALPVPPTPSQAPSRLLQRGLRMGRWPRLSETSPPTAAAKLAATMVGSIGGDTTAGPTSLHTAIVPRESAEDLGAGMGGGSGSPNGASNGVPAHGPVGAMGAGLIPTFPRLPPQEEEGSSHLEEGNFTTTQQQGQQQPQPQQEEKTAKRGARVGRWTLKRASTGQLQQL
ncbi:hypothetical protein Vretimale_10045, partial [Volvox reticuliferus]